MDQKKVTRKKFRELCRTEDNPISHSTLQTAIRYRHVIEEQDENGGYLIDLENELNKMFLDRKQSEANAKDRQNATKVEIKRKSLDVQIKERDLHMRDMQIAKLNAELIPTALVGDLLRSHVKQLQLDLKASLERYVVDAIRKFGGSRQDAAASRAYVVEGINEATEKARVAMKGRLVQIVDEYKKSK